MRVAQVNTGARLNMRVARARLGRAPRVGTMIRPPEISFQAFTTENKI